MLTLPLEPTDDRAKPSFKDAAACTKWLAQMQFTNLQMAQANLRTQLDEFNRFPVRGLVRLQTLEVLRETVHHVQVDYAKKLVAKALPLSDIEMATLASISGLWQGMACGYQRCLQDYHTGDKQLAPFGALLCHRSLLYVGLQIFEHLRVGYEFDGQLWQQLHTVYAFAEEQGLLQATVNDEVSEYDQTTSCRSIYIRTLLACHAHPEELTRGQQQWLNRWLSVWTPTIALDRSYGTYAVSQGDAPTLAIDLNSSLGLQQIGNGLPDGDSLRYLAMVPMSKLLRVKIILLQQGQSPQQLDLGDGCDTFGCTELLTHLHKCWCEPPVERLFGRRASSQEIQVCYELEGIHSYISNRPFNMAKKQAGSSLGYPLETYLVEDESILGARLLRQVPDGIRLNVNQIVATRAAEGKPYMAGVTVWVSIKRTGQLHVGIRYLPGAPQAITVKSNIPIPGTAHTSAAALLLPAMPDMNIPSSLIIPRSMFEAGRVLEVTLPDNKKMSVKLRFSVERGVDYDRVSFTPA